MKIYLFWSALLLATWAMVTAIQLFFKNKKIKIFWRVLLAAGKLLGAVAFAGLVMAGPVFLRPVQPLLVALYAVLLPEAVADLLYLIWIGAKKRERKFGAQKLLSLLFCLAFCVFGTVNMQLIRPQYHSFRSEKLTAEHRFIFVSDLHVGFAQPISVTLSAIKEMAAQQPDFIILGGDITDDYTSKADMKATYEAFGSCGIPVYFIYGNHEVVQHPEYLVHGLPYTQEELLQVLEGNGITVLTDDYCVLAPDLQLLGRADAASDSRKTADELPHPDTDKYLICADHQPLLQENLAIGADLQLSGHTHAGQLFPLKSLYALIGGYVYGEYTAEQTTLLVSAGASGWRVPFRTDAHSCYDVISLKPAE